MGKKKKEKPTQLWFIRHKKVAAGVAAGLAVAAAMGWTGYNLLNPDPYKNKGQYPEKSRVMEVTDGDSVAMANGRLFRLIGIDAPNRGDKGYEEAKDKLVKLTLEKDVWLEYDRYNDDMYGRILVWVWIGCSDPKFTPPNYMRLSFNRSREGLLANPEGCEKGKLIQEEMVKAGMAKVEAFKDRGELKYEKRLRN